MENEKEETITFRVQGSLKLDFQEAAKEMDIPTSALLRDFMRDLVNRHQERKTSQKGSKKHGR